MKEPERIICRSCWTEHTTAESMICSCGAEIFLAKEIREKILSIDRQVTTLQAEAAMLRQELWAREHRHSRSDSRTLLIENTKFYHNVVGAPHQGNSSRKVFIPIVNPSDFA